MTAAPQPQVQNRDDLGDVLAEIRRLVGRDGPARAVGDAPLPLRLAASSTGDPGEPPIRPLQNLPQTGRVPLADRDTDDPGRQDAQESDRDALPAPFRLNPDALVPLVQPHASPASRLRLTSGLPAGERALAQAGTGQPVGGERFDLDSRPPLASPDPDTLQAKATGAIPPPQAVAPQPVPEPISRDDGMTFPSGGSPASVTPAAPQPAFGIDADADGLPSTAAGRDSSLGTGEASPPHDTRPRTSSVGGASGADANPLRALLREAVREEFDARLTGCMDDHLRRLIRAEITAALTEALLPRPGG